MVTELDRLIELADRALVDLPKEVKTDPLAGLSPKEVRERFDEYGEPREGFDVDGNPVQARHRPR